MAAATVADSDNSGSIFSGFRNIIDATSEYESESTSA